VSSDITWISKTSKIELPTGYNEIQCSPFIIAL